MTWWQQLTHPEGNVVAATIVLVGVVVTGAVTFWVSALSRRNERQKEVDARVAKIRDAAYVDARSVMIEVTRFPSRVDEQTGEKIRGISASLRIFAAEGAMDAFYAYVVAAGEPQTAKATLYELQKTFDDLARADVREVTAKKR